MSTNSIAAAAMDAHFDLVLGVQHQHRKVEPLVVVGNVADFDAVREVLHDSDYVQVRIVTNAGEVVTYARKIRQRYGMDNAWKYSAATARQVEETAGLVSAPALVAWLLDSGFYLVK